MAGYGGKSNSSNHVALTAHVLIALDKATPRLSGDSRKTKHGRAQSKLTLSSLIWDEI